jgi:hypothetical protein
MRMTREFSRGLIIAMLVSQLPFSALALLRFVCAACAKRERAMRRALAARVRLEPRRSSPQPSL